MYENLQHIQLAVDGHQTYHLPLTTRDKIRQFKAANHYSFVVLWL